MVKTTRELCSTKIRHNDRNSQQIIDV